MQEKKQPILVYVLLVAVGVGVGFAIGATVCGKKNGANGAPSTTEFNSKSDEELSAGLSEIMMPNAEYEKLLQAIHQTGMGLLRAQAQGSAIEVNEATEAKLKESIANKYSRKYFTDMNAKSMSELSKEDLINVLSFYSTPAGEKFLRLSPVIIETTMKTIQMDLAAWLPQTVDKMVGDLKGGAKEEGAADDKEKAAEEPSKS